MPKVKSAEIKRLVIKKSVFTEILEITYNTLLVRFYFSIMYLRSVRLFKAGVKQAASVVNNQIPNLARLS